MKCLRFLLALAMLFCGFSTLAKASNFHATVLDPPPTNCSIPTECNVGEQLSFPITLTTMECTDINVPPTPPPTPATDGCFKGFNATGETITSLEVTFADTTGLGTLTCDTADNPPGLPSTVFGADPTWYRAADLEKAVRPLGPRNQGCHPATGPRAGASHPLRTLAHGGARHANHGNAERYC